MTGEIPAPHPADCDPECSAAPHMPGCLAALLHAAEDGDDEEFSRHLAARADRPIGLLL